MLPFSHNKVSNIQRKTGGIKLDSTEIAIIVFLSVVIVLLIIPLVQIFKKIRSSGKDNFNLIKFPKETKNEIKNLIKEVNKFSKSLKLSFKKEVMENKKIISDVDEKLKPFEKVANEKTEELKLFKEGNEYAKHKALLKGIMETIEFIEDAEKKIKFDDGIAKSYFTNTKEKLLIVLFNSGIEKFEPNLNTSNLDHPGCRAHPITEPTNDKKKIQLIHSVIRPGYKIELKKGEIFYIRYAEVKVYSLSKEHTIKKKEKSNNVV